MRKTLGFILVLILPSVLAAATRLQLHDAAGQVSGYKAADRNLGATTTTAVTNSGGSPPYQWTKTAGGSTVAWISPPLTGSVTISGTIIFNDWGKESNAKCNCGFQATVHKYTTSEGAAFITSAKGSELGTGNASVQNWTGSPTSTSFSAGDRIVVKMWINSAGGSMAAGYTATGDYDGATGGSDGDAYVEFTETFAFQNPVAETATLTLGTESVARVKTSNAPLTASTSVSATLGNSLGCHDALSLTSSLGESVSTANTVTRFPTTTIGTGASLSAQKGTAGGEHTIDLTATLSTNTLADTSMACHPAETYTASALNESVQAQKQSGSEHSVPLTVTFTEIFALDSSCGAQAAESATSTLSEAAARSVGTHVTANLNLVSANLAATGYHPQQNFNVLPTANLSFTSGVGKLLALNRSPSTSLSTSPQTPTYNAGRQRTPSTTLTISPAVARSHGNPRNETATLTASPSLARVAAIGESVSTSVPLQSASLTRQSAHGQAEVTTLTTSESVAKNLGRNGTPSTALTVSATVARSHGNPRTDTTTLSLSEIAARSLSKELTAQLQVQSISLVAQGINNYAAYPTTNLSLSSGVDRTTELHPSLSASFTLTPSLIASHGNPRVDTTTLIVSASLARSIGEVLTATISLQTVSLSRVPNRAVSPATTFSLSSAVTRRAGLHSSASTTLTLAPTLSASALSRYVGPSDSVPTTANLIRSKGTARARSTTLAISEGLGKGPGMELTGQLQLLATLLVVYSPYQTSSSYTTNLTANVPTSDQFGKNISLLKGVQDYLWLPTSSLLSSFGHPSSLSDTLTLSASVSKLHGNWRGPTYTGTLSEIASHSGSLSLPLSDTFTLTPALHIYTSTFGLVRPQISVLP